MQEIQMEKKAIIFGDSYSTFAGEVPAGYAVYYTPTDEKCSGVTDVSETWWHIVMREAGLKLVLNNSWSGATVCYTAYGGRDCSRDSSFIYRLRRLTADGFFKENDIDTVFIFGGTNDSWSNAPLGEEKHSEWEERDLYSVLCAVPYYLKSVRDTLPSAEIYCLINTEIKDEIASCLKSSCDRYGITPITFNKIDKVNGHPTKQGMLDIANTVLDAMK